METNFLFACLLAGDAAHLWGKINGEGVNAFLCQQQSHFAGAAAKVASGSYAGKNGTQDCFSGGGKGPTKLK